MRRLSVALAVALLVAAPRASAQTDVEAAKTLFTAGAQAYEKGDFPAAIQAFEQAQKRAPRAAIVFSIAQAHKRQYYIDSNPEHLKAAVAKYREYIAQAPDGSRKADAAQALAELGPAADRLAASTEPPRPPPKQPARISINSTGTPNVHISLDGAPGVDPPLITVVPEGKHKVVVSADGYQEETHEVIAVDGSLDAQDFPLKEKPAQIFVHADGGARIEVDGRAAGTTPLSSPISVPPGTHLITVARNGHDAAIHELQLGRGQVKKLDLVMPTSTQRKVATGFLVVGAIGVVGGGVFTGLALDREAVAQKITDSSHQRNISASDLANANSALDLRNTWTTAAFISFGAGVAFAATGLLLFAFDQPSLSGPVVREKTDHAPTQTDEPKKLAPTEIGLAPAIGPGVLGASMTGRF